MVAAVAPIVGLLLVLSAIIVPWSTRGLSVETEKRLSPASLRSRIPSRRLRRRRYPGLRTLMVAGAIVTLGGKPTVERDLVRRSDISEHDTPVDEAAPREPAGIWAALIEDLTAQKTAALRAAFSENVPVALALTVHALALPAFPFARRTDLPSDQSAGDLP